MKTNKELALEALYRMRGDDLYRAQAEFRGMSEAQMGEQYGQSGQTRAQIVKGYQEHNDRVDAAIAWVKSNRHE